MVKICQGLIGIETCMHLTCTNMPKEKVDIALKVTPFCLMLMEEQNTYIILLPVGSETTWVSECSGPQR